MTDAPETPHIHGTPIVDVPQSVSELYKWAKAKFDALENQKPVEAPPAPPVAEPEPSPVAPGTDTVQ